MNLAKPLLPDEEIMASGDDTHTHSMRMLGILPRILGIVPLTPHTPMPITYFLRGLACLGVFAPVGYTFWEGFRFGVRDSLMVEIILLINPICSFFFAYTYCRWDHFGMLVESSRDLNKARVAAANRSYRIMQGVLLALLICGLVTVELVSRYSDTVRKPDGIYALRTVGWLYIFISFVFFVSLFDFVCALQVQQIISYSAMLNDESASIVMLCEEYFRLREQLARTSHHFRAFICMLVLATTVGALLGLYVFFEQGIAQSLRLSILVLLGLEVAAHIVMAITTVRAAAKVTHLCEKVPGMIATMRTACSVSMLAHSTSHASYSLRRSMEIPLLNGSPNVPSTRASFSGSASLPVVAPTASAAAPAVSGPEARPAELQIPAHVYGSPVPPSPNQSLYKDGQLRADQLNVLYGCVQANPMGIRLFGITVSRDTLLKVASMYLALCLFLMQRVITNNASNSSSGGGGGGMSSSSG